MVPNKHILYGFVFSILVVAIVPQIGFIGAAMLFLSSILIDVDHYFASVMSGNGFSINKAYEWYIKKNNSKINDSKINNFFKWMIPFHSIEFFSVLFALWYLSVGIISNILFYIIIGCLFHMLLDFIDLKRCGYPFYLKLFFFYTLYVNYRYLKYNIKPKHLNRCEY